MIRRTARQQDTVLVASRCRPRRYRVGGPVDGEQTLDDHVRKRALGLPATRPGRPVTDIGIIACDGIVIASRRSLVLLRDHQIRPSNEGVSSASMTPRSRSPSLMYGGVGSQWRPQPVAWT